MAKVNVVIADALSTAGVGGVGQPVLAEDSNKAFRRLNGMLAEWRRLKIYVYGEQDVSFAGTGAVSYSIGPAQTVNAARPNKILAAFRRQIVPSTPSPVDTPLMIINAREDYNRISLKVLSPVPSHLFYDPTYPYGTIYPWPVPSAAYEIHMSVLRELPAFVTANDDIILPPEVEEALHWNLAKRLRIMYRKGLDNEVNKQARNSRQVLIQSNLSIPTLQMPSGIPNAGGIGYNIYTDGR